MGLVDNPLVEMWSLYVIGSLIIFLRVACRWKMVGIQNFKPDDYIIWLSWVSLAKPTLESLLYAQSGIMLTIMTHGLVYR